MSKYLLCQNQGQVGLGIKSLNVKGKGVRDIRWMDTYECQYDARTKNYLNSISKYKVKMDLAKVGRLASALALLTRSLGFC